jgi:ApbE superfamily uncharacterized protein (UPF0280 family)
MKVRPEKRFYRKFQKPQGYTTFEVIVGESDLWIGVPEKSFKEELPKLLTEKLIYLRSQIESYCRKEPSFCSSLSPVEVPPIAPLIVKKMAESSKKFQVGPMASVAGAVNYFIGRELFSLGIEEFIIENGGDLFIKRKERTKLLLVGKGPAQKGLPLTLPPGTYGVSSSSSKIGHSLSLGRSEIATAVTLDPADSDACATYLGNSKSVEEALENVKKLPEEVLAALVVIDGKFVMKGELLQELFKTSLTT